MGSEEVKTHLCDAKIDQDKFQKMKEIEITFSETTTNDYQLILFEEVELKRNMKTDSEEFEKVTELEREWELFRRAELKEQLENWIRIKRKLEIKKNIK